MSNPEKELDVKECDIQKILHIKELDVQECDIQTIVRLKELDVQECDGKNVGRLLLQPGRIGRQG